MGLFNFFKKKKDKEVQIAKINHYFYAVIATKIPYEIDAEKFIPFDEVQPNIYKEMNFFFFKVSNLREYLLSRMKTTQYFDKIYFYSICIQPITEDSQDLTKEVFANHLDSIGMNLYKSNSLRISFINDFTESISLNLMPGIRSSEDLNECLSNLYPRTFDKKLKPRVYDILKEEEKNGRFDFSIINAAKNVLDEGTIVNIFYNNYQKENWIAIFTKELVDTMLMVQERQDHIKKE